MIFIITKNVKRLRNTFNFSYFISFSLMFIIEGPVLSYSCSYKGAYMELAVIGNFHYGKPH